MILATMLRWVCCLYLRSKEIERRELRFKESKVRMLEYLPGQVQQALGDPSTQSFLRTRGTYENSYLLCSNGKLYEGKAPHESPIHTPEPIIAVHSHWLRHVHVLGYSGQSYKVVYQGYFQFRPVSRPKGEYFYEEGDPCPWYIFLKLR
jgi:hypothetical protein